MNQYLTLEDGHIEYWSVYGITCGLKIFNSQKGALEYMKNANEGFLRGVMFHNEKQGVSLL